VELRDALAVESKALELSQASEKLLQKRLELVQHVKSQQTEATHPVLV